MSRISPLNDAERTNRLAMPSVYGETPYAHYFFYLYLYIVGHSQNFTKDISLTICFKESVLRRLIL
jgi:hypothetical protein